MLILFLIATVIACRVDTADRNLPPPSEEFAPCPSLDVSALTAVPPMSQDVHGRFTEECVRGLFGSEFVLPDLSPEWIHSSSVSRRKARVIFSLDISRRVQIDRASCWTSTSIQARLAVSAI